MNDPINISVESVFRAENFAESDSGPHLDPTRIFGSESFRLDGLRDGISRYRRCLQLHQGSIALII
jgi:hypothetical protein